eukprot:TRINITY_DN72686_c0_g1_i1.p1 TRINITY_DN72686_c0_g1~~TRINITY_DN72686_c0_g1_i1.p1  ORF type:complete len:544 (-),score=91.57 TRINITY_DN72686_c0_g1_i1:184-1737(-)
MATAAPGSRRGTTARAKAWACRPGNRRCLPKLLLFGALAAACVWLPPTSVPSPPSSPAGLESGDTPGLVASLQRFGTPAFYAVVAVYYGMAWSQAQALKAEEDSAGETKLEAPVKKPRIAALDSLRFVLIAYIASGHFIFTATSNKFLLRLITQINVVVGAFFVISGYVAAYTTTELAQRKGSKRLDNAVEFAVSRIMGHWPLHLFVLLVFAPMFLWVDMKYSGPSVALWNGTISAFMLQAWFPTSAEVWNAPTWFLSALTVAMCVLCYALRLLAGQKKAELRRSLVLLTVLALVPKIAYSWDLNCWGIMEGTLNAKTHPNYALFNQLRFSPYGALVEVLMGSTACRLVMLDTPKHAETSGSSMVPMIGMLAILLLRATVTVQINDMIIRSGIFIPLWIVLLMRIHRESVGPEGPSKGLPRLLCMRLLNFLGGISFPIFIVHGPIGQVFYKKAVAQALFGQVLASPQPNGVHWFFGVYWAVVLVAAWLVQKMFLESKSVQEVSKASTQFLVKLLGGA